MGSRERRGETDGLGPRARMSASCPGPDASRGIFPARLADAAGRSYSSLMKPGRMTPGDDPLTPEKLDEASWHDSGGGGGTRFDLGLGPGLRWGWRRGRWWRWRQAGHGPLHRPRHRHELPARGRLRPDRHELL